MKEIIAIIALLLYIGLIIMFGPIIILLFLISEFIRNESGIKDGGRENPIAKFLKSIADKIWYYFTGAKF